ncbi:uncharacterized protein [Periplaneta americana]|uniref:uncharacterized protein n=1 Tax=Periplaneta americana TaxID=6978 RepID=UPI0037E97880
MSAPKWNSNDIMKFLEVYERYELLWNTHNKEYLNKTKRELMFQKLVSELKKQGFEKIDIEVVRKKIKTLKTVYRQELTKIAKSKQSAVWPEDIIYKPKLAWFEKADSFLRCVTAGTASTSTLDLKTDLEEVSDGEGSVHIEPEVCLQYSSQNTVRRLSPSTPPSSKRAKTTGINAVKEEVTNLQCVMSNSNDSDEFQQFANHIATQLKQLPLQNALLLQEKIQSLITRERISCMTSPQAQTPSRTQEVSVVYVSPPPTSSGDM